MSNDYYTAGLVPATYGPVNSQELREEFARLETAFGRLPNLVSSAGGGFSGGVFANSQFTNPTVEGGSIGSFANPSTMNFRYVQMRTDISSSFDLDAYWDNLYKYAGMYGSKASSNAHGVDIAVLYATKARIGMSVAGDVFAGGDTKAVLPLAGTTHFFHIPKCEGVPTGVPNLNLPGHVPIIYDSTNNRLYIYDGGWRYAATV